MHRRDFSIMPVLYQKYLQTSPNVPWEITLPQVENHYSRQKSVNPSKTIHGFQKRRKAKEDTAKSTKKDKNKSRLTV